MNNEKINSGGGSYSSPCSKRGTGFCGCGGGQCGLEKSAAPTARDAGTISGPIQRYEPGAGWETAMDKYEFGGYVLYADHRQHVAAAVEAAYQAGLRQGTEDGVSMQMLRPDFDLAKLRSTAGVGEVVAYMVRSPRTGKARFMGKAKRHLVEHWQGTGYEVTPLCAATAPVSAAEDLALCQTQDQTADEQELLALPNGVQIEYGSPAFMEEAFPGPMYTADQMREYARAALAMCQLQGDDDELVKALRSARDLLANTDGLSKNNIDNLAGEEAAKIDALLAAKQTGKDTL